MNTEPPPGLRGGSVKVARLSSVRGSSTSSRGPSTPTQIVTIRPRLSKVTDAQSADLKVDVTAMSRPSGPAWR